MLWQNPDEEPAVKPVILSKGTMPKREAIPGARTREGNVGPGVWMWWTDGSPSNNGRVGAAAVGKHGDRWKTFCSHLRTQ